MPRYFWTWFGPKAEQHPNKCALKKKSKVRIVIAAHLLDAPETKLAFQD